MELIIPQELLFGSSPAIVGLNLLTYRELACDRYRKAAIMTWTTVIGSDNENEHKQKN